MRKVLPRILALVTLLALASCSAVTRTGERDVSRAQGDYGKAQPLVDRAKADLAKRLGITVDKITVQSVEATEFSDTSLGVREPGKVYAQVITPGYIIKLAVEDKVYEYHASAKNIVLVPAENASESGG